MPFDLTSLTAEQCNRFVDRLATHLHHADARARLMAVREAFAKAAGFPDAHAAERASPSEPFSKTLLWASQAWKKHRRRHGCRRPRLLEPNRSVLTGQVSGQIPANIVAGKARSAPGG